MTVTEMGQILQRYAERHGQHTFSGANVRVMSDGSGRIVLEPENEIVERFANPMELERCIQDIQQDLRLVEMSGK